MKPSHPVRHSMVLEELEAQAAHGGWVQGLARRLASDTHLAEDLVQEAWLQALQGGDRAHGPLSAWLAGVIRRLSANRTRTDARRAQHEERAASSESVAPASETAEKLEQQALLIQSALSLDEPYRSAILMRYIEEKSQRAIAAELDVPVATVNSRLTRGLEQLRVVLLRAHGGDETRWLGSMLMLSKVSTKDGMALFGVALMKSKLTLVACLFLILTGVFLAQGTGLEPAALPADEDRSAVLEPALSSEPPAIADASAAGEPQENSRRTDLAVAQEPPAALPYLLRLVHGESGSPAAGATLYLSDMARMMRDPDALKRMNSQGPLFDLERQCSVAVELGERFVADEAGVVHFGAANDGSTFYATLESSAGYMQFMSPGKPAGGTTDLVELKLWPRAEVHVRVTGEFGQALPGVPLLLLSSGGPYAVPLERAQTDAHGMAVFRPLAATEALFGEDRAGHMKVLVDLPAARDESQSFIARANERIDLELISPLAASLEFEIFLSASEPLPDGSVVLLRAVEEGDYMPLALASAVALGRTESGRVRFERIAPGLTLDLIVPLVNRMDRWTMRLDGPSAVGEVLKQRVVMGASTHRYHGVLLASNGAPYDQAEFNVVFDSGNGSGHLWQETCDDQGRFEFELLGLDDKAPAGEFRFQPLYDGGELSRVEHVLSLTQHDQGADHDLGQIQFESEPAALVSGVLLDPKGQPLANGFVRWIVSGAADAQVGRHEPGLAAQQTDELGRFTFYGTFPADGEVSIRVDPVGGWRMEPLRLFGSAQNLVLQLRSTASISGSVLLDALPGKLSLRVGVWNLEQGEHAARSAAGWVERRVDSDGHFELSGLRPGPHTFVLEIDGSRDALLRLERIDVRADGLTDSRLQRIDLRGALRIVRVEMVDGARGFPVPCEVWFVPDEGATVHLRGGDGLLLPGHAQGCLVALPESGLPDVVRLTSDDHYILRANAGVDVELRWAGEHPLESYPHTFNVWLDLDPGDSGDPATLRARKKQLRLANCGGLLLPGETKHVTLPGPGNYTAFWSASGSDRAHRKLGVSTSFRLAENQRVLELAPPPEWASSQD